MATEKSNTTINNMQFLASTQKHINSLGVKICNSESEVLSWTFPHNNLLSNIFLMCEFNVKFTNSTSSTISLTPLKNLAIEKVADLIRRVTFDVNVEGVTTAVSGGELALLNQLLSNNCHVKGSTNSVFYTCKLPSESLSASSSTTVSFSFFLDLELVLNQKELIGLIPLQAKTTIATLTMDFSNPSTIFSTTYGTPEISSIKIKPYYQNFTIPKVNGVTVLPDTDCIKNVVSQTYTLTNGKNKIELRTGAGIYRKIVIIFPNSLKPGNITSDIECMINQNNKIWQCSQALMRTLNQKAFGWSETKDAIIFDLSDNGQPNFGGTRDYIDSRNITEFWLEFDTDTTGDIKIIAETIELV